MKWSLSLLVVVALPVFIFSAPCVADIRHTRIKSKDQTRAPVFIDVFGFSGTGRLQLNLSRISFSNPNPDLNLTLSHMGFFLARRLIFSVDNFYFDAPCILQTGHAMLLYTIGGDALKNKKSIDILLNVTEADVFNLYFENCLSPEIRVSMDIRSAMYNLEPETSEQNYLSARKNFLFVIYFVLACIYFTFSAFWIGALHRQRNSEGGAFEIHHVMLLFPVLKLFNFLVELLRLRYIKHAGYTQSLVPVLLTYIGAFGGPVPLYLFLDLIGIGWPFLVPTPSMCSYTTFLAPALFNVLVVSFPPTADMPPVSTSLSLIIDAAKVYGTIYNITLTTDYLLQAGQVEGKAGLILRKVLLFRKLYLATVIYNYVYFFIVGFVDMYICWNKYLWIGAFAEESAMLVMYVVVVFIFWPISHNQILLINDEEEKAAAEALKDWKNFKLHVFSLWISI